MSKKGIKLLLSALLCFVLMPVLTSGAADIVPINETTFPDKAFREYVLGKPGAQDKYFQQDELEAITQIDCSGLGIKDLKGLEYFKNLSVFDCSRNDMAKIDLAGRKFPKLTSVTVKDCSKLEKVSIVGTRVTDMTLRNCRSLETVDLFSNEISNLSVSGCDKMWKLSLNKNKLTSLDGIDDCPSLTKLEVSSNKLTSINVSGMKKLQFIDYSYNKVEDRVHFEDTGELCRISCVGTGLTYLPFTNADYPKLFCLVVSDNELKDINLKNLPEMKIFVAENCGTETVDVSAAKNLSLLGCSHNKLSGIDLSGNEKIEDLDVQDNNLYSLDLDNCRGVLKDGWSDSYCAAGTTTMSHCGYWCEDNKNIVKGGDTVSAVMPGLDMSRVSNVRGGFLDGDRITFDYGSQEIKYDYKLFKNRKETGEFTLVRKKLTGEVQYRIDGQIAAKAWTSDYVEPVFTGAAADIPRELIRADWQYSDNKCDWVSTGYGVYGHDITNAEGGYLRGVFSAVGYAGEIVGEVIFVKPAIDAIYIDVKQPVEDELPSYDVSFSIKQDDGTFADMGHICTSYVDYKSTFYWMNERGVDQKDNEPFISGRKYEANMTMRIDNYYKNGGYSRFSNNLIVYVNGKEAKVSPLDHWSVDVRCSLVAEPSPFKKIDYVTASVTRPMAGMYTGDISVSTDESAPFELCNVLTEWSVGTSWNDSAHIGDNVPFEGGKTYFAVLTMAIKDPSSCKFTNRIQYANIENASVVRREVINGSEAKLILRFEVPDPNEVKDAPVFSHDSMIYDGKQFYVTITSQNPKVNEIYYTLDGSDPRIPSGRYQIKPGEQVAISSATRTLKAAAFYDDLYSPVTSATYTYMMDVYFRTSERYKLKLEVDGVERSLSSMPVKIAHGSHIRLEAVIPDGYRFNSWNISELGTKPEKNTNPVEFYIGNYNDKNTKYPISANVAEETGVMYGEVMSPFIDSSMPERAYNLIARAADRDAPYYVEVSKVQHYDDGTFTDMQAGERFEFGNQYAFTVSFNSSNNDLFMKDNPRIFINGKAPYSVERVVRTDYTNSVKATVILTPDIWFLGFEKYGQGIRAEIASGFEGKYLLAASYDSEGRMIDCNTAYITERKAYNQTITLNIESLETRGADHVNFFVVTRGSNKIIAPKVKVFVN